MSKSIKSDVLFHNRQMFRFSFPGGLEIVYHLTPS